MENESIFLTTEQALEAIRIDFRQYEPQILLFCSVLGLMSQNTIRFKHEPGQQGLWINQDGRSNMRWLEGRELIDFMCAAIDRTQWNAELLTAVCSRVFQSCARPAVGHRNGRSGLVIETQMESFACRQCGRCCRVLDYQHEVTADDVLRWKKLERTDILEWVETINRDDGGTAYRIWVVPGTRQRAETCPFLKKDPTSNRWGCRIHADKPQICRNYPVNRKHAVMTGCPGFEKDQP
jgi:Fe-S-cluster containining protein